MIFVNFVRHFHGMNRMDNYYKGLNCLYCPLLSVDPLQTNWNHHSSFVHKFLRPCFPLSNLEVQLQSKNFKVVEWV